MWIGRRKETEKVGPVSGEVITACKNSKKDSVIYSIESVLYKPFIIITPLNHLQ